MGNSKVYTAFDKNLSSRNKTLFVCNKIAVKFIYTQKFVGSWSLYLMLLVRQIFMEFKFSIHGSY